MNNDPATEASIHPDCAHAMHFARSAYQLMRYGLSDDEITTEFGGPSNVEPGARSILEYVLLYRHTHRMTADKIVHLAGARCNSGGFGDVSCPALPAAYTQAGGGCTGEFSAQDATPDVDIFARHAERLRRDHEESVAMQREQMAALRQQEERRRQTLACQERVRKQLNIVELQAETSSDPNRFRLELRRLREQLAKCG